MDNPYAPVSTQSAIPSDIALYSPGHVAWASFLGSPLAGGAVLALNYLRLRKSKAGVIALLAGSILTVGLMMLAFLLPEDFPSSPIPIAYTIGMYQVTKLLQGDEYRQHLSRGGDKGSAWVATGIGILSLLILLIFLFGALLVMPSEWFP